MPGFDYSRFDKLDASDSEDEGGEINTRNAVDDSDEVLKELPPDLPRDLALVLAAKNGQKNIVEALLARRVAVDARDPHGRTALLNAVVGGIGNRAIIETLLQHRADICLQGHDGLTPLGQAASTDSPELCQCLLDMGSPSSADRGEALVAAAKACSRKTTRLLLNSQADVCKAVNSDGRTALHCWAEQGDGDLLRLLLEGRASVNAQDARGRIPLAYAVRAGSEVSVQLLCSHNSDASAIDFEDRQLIVEAAELKQEQKAAAITRALLTFRASVESGGLPLVVASCVGHTAVVEALLEARAAADSVDPAGRRPLPCAAAAGALPLCSMLLDSRAEVDGRGTSISISRPNSVPKDAGGVTALSIAAASGHRELGIALLDRHANPETTDERGARPLMAAAVAASSTDLLIALLAARADVDAQQEGSGKTALIFAAGAGRAEACRTLLKASAAPDLQAETGAAALHAAAANGHREACSVLLQANADAKALGPGGKAPADLASIGGHADLAAMLVSVAAPVPGVSVA
jgi:ankyrin repeat protein